MTSLQSNDINCLSGGKACVTLSLAPVTHLSLPLPPSPVTPYSPYSVLSTDYVSGAVVYSCTDIMRVFHVHYAWILGRSRSLPLQTLEHARQLLTQEHVDITLMTATDQNGCDFP